LLSLKSSICRKRLGLALKKEEKKKRDKCLIGKKKRKKCSPSSLKISKFPKERYIFFKERK
jgi:hypothetical protein